MGDRKVTAVLATAGTFIAIPISWTIPQSTFSGLAMGMAAINSIGQLSGMVAPVMVGRATICPAPRTWACSIAPLILIACVVVMRYVKNPESRIQSGRDAD